MPGLLTTTLSSLVLLLTAACAGEGAAGPGDRVGAAAAGPVAGRTR